MGKSESKGEKQLKERRYDSELLKKGLRCDLDQHEMLKRCSDKKDMTEWNKWREKYPDEDVELEGGQFYKVHGEDKALVLIKRESPTLSYENGENAWIEGMNLQNANLNGAYLSNAAFWDAKLQGSMFDCADLRRANFAGAYLEGSTFAEARLQGTCFAMARVDEKTTFWNCEVDRYVGPSKGTNFDGIPLDVVRIDTATKQLLEYNIRRMNWEEWYGDHPRLKWLVKPFWLMSDYGLSTTRIIFTFFGLALVFANVYYHWGRIASPGIVENLFTDQNGVAVHWLLVPLRTLYFSIVTMTTLGFGDMYANAHTIFGHILLSFQVILGYVLLGALVTRFAVLFTAGGPAGKFADKEGKLQGTQRKV